MSDRELFREVFKYFQSTYRGLEMTGSIVSYKGEPVMNIEGFNLLYNLTRLCRVLQDELL